jgi:hypothetical protein
VLLILLLGFFGKEYSSTLRPHIDQDKLEMVLICLGRFSLNIARGHLYELKMGADYNGPGCHGDALSIG